jgi:hypothetical protein
MRGGSGRRGGGLGGAGGCESSGGCDGCSAARSIQSPRIWTKGVDLGIVKLSSPRRRSVRVGLRSDALLRFAGLFVGGSATVTGRPTGRIGLVYRWKMVLQKKARDHASREIDVSMYYWWYKFS